MIRLRWMNGLEHNYRLSLELVEQKKCVSNRRWANADLTLEKRWRRWGSIKAELG